MLNAKRAPFRDREWTIILTLPERPSPCSPPPLPEFPRLFTAPSTRSASEPDYILKPGMNQLNLPAKMANYTLLSGGEKALVGIALMFAVLTVRPTPVCLMDEVDAALDEANIDRFTAFLREKTSTSQFVMISHRQSTMESANVLWGVTMEEEGVSKVISVRLTESA
jgi:chromosome segregation protein